jgi:hypothetical protein
MPAQEILVRAVFTVTGIIFHSLVLQ